MGANGGLEEWAERFGRSRAGCPPDGRLRFAFYGNGVDRGLAGLLLVASGAAGAGRRTGSRARGDRGAEYERAFYGGQYALMVPLFEHYGVRL